MNTSETRSPRISRLLAVGALGAVAAAAVNTLIYGIGRAADIAYVITQNSSGTETVGLADVLSLTLMAFAVGLAAAAVSIRWGRPSLRVLQIVGAVLAVVTTFSDVTLDGTTAAKLTLALMHVVVGVAYIVSLEIVRSTPTRSLATAPVDQVSIPT